MKYRTIRGLLLVCGAAALLALAPARSQAQCGLFGLRCFFGGEPTMRVPYAAPYTTYSPVVAAPASPVVASPLWRPFAAGRTTFSPVVGCGTCPTPTAGNSCVTQQCSYTPRTAYRTVYDVVPVTTQRAVTAIDSCSGCAVTAYRPEVTYVRRARLVPYTSYSLACTNGCNPCGTGGYATVDSGCATGACGAIVRSAASVAPPAADNEGSVLADPAKPETPQTFAPKSNGTSTPPADAGKPAEGGAAPTPAPGADVSFPLHQVPRLIAPENRVTARPIRLISLQTNQDLALVPIVRPANVEPVVEKIDDSGWHAVRD